MARSRALRDDADAMLPEVRRTLGWMDLGLKVLRVVRQVREMKPWSWMGLGLLSAALLGKSSGASSAIEKTVSVAKKIFSYWGIAKKALSFVQSFRRQPSPTS